MICSQICSPKADCLRFLARRFAHWCAVSPGVLPKDEATKEVKHWQAQWDALKAEGAVWRVAGNQNLWRAFKGAKLGQVWFLEVLEDPFSGGVLSLFAALQRRAMANRAPVPRYIKWEHLRLRSHPFGRWEQKLCYLWSVPRCVLFIDFCIVKLCQAR